MRRRSLADAPHSGSLPYKHKRRTLAGAPYSGSLTSNRTRLSLSWALRLASPPSKRQERSLLSFPGFYGRRRLDLGGSVLAAVLIDSAFRALAAVLVLSAFLALAAVSVLAAVLNLAAVLLLALVSSTDRAHANEREGNHAEKPCLRVESPQPIRPSTSTPVKKDRALDSPLDTIYLRGYPEPCPASLKGIA